MEFVGKVVNVLNVEEGVSKSGNNWKKQGFVVETIGQYPKKIKVDLIGKRVDSISLTLNKTYTFSVDAESREFNGKWYTEISVFAAVESNI